MSCADSSSVASASGSAAGRTSVCGLAPARLSPIQRSTPFATSLTAASSWSMLGARRRVPRDRWLAALRMLFFQDTWLLSTLTRKRSRLILVCYDSVATTIFACNMHYSLVCDAFCRWLHAPLSEVSVEKRRGGPSAPRPSTTPRDRHARITALSGATNDASKPSLQRKRCLLQLQAQLRRCAMQVSSNLAISPRFTCALN